jgi:hypothetical protein
MVKILLKRVLPTVVGIAVFVLAALWLYGFIGVKAGWIGPTEVPGLNAVSHSGADAAGGVGGAAKAKLGL